MTHQYTKLADWHQAMADEPKRNQAKREKHAETARILRAAAGADVAGLMDVADRYALAQADPAHWRAALESDLRLALVGREWQPIETAPKDGRQLILLLTPSGFPQVAYSNTWWTAGFSVECKPTHWMPLPAAAPKGTYPQEDRSREPPCHACGLGYKCRSANCPNTTPDPMTGPHRKEHHDQP